MTGRPIAFVISCVVAILALLDVIEDADHFVFTRWIVTGAALVALNSRPTALMLQPWKGFFIAIAILWNPIFPVYLHNRGVWLLLDTVGIIVFVLAIGKAEAVSRATTPSPPRPIVRFPTEHQRTPLPGKVVKNEIRDRDGGISTRGSGTDFNTLRDRLIDVLYAAPGFSAEVEEWIDYAYGSYEKGAYEEALRHLNLAVSRAPELHPYLFYYIRVCERVLAVPPTKAEAEYERELRRFESLPTWLRSMWMPGFKVRLRCKWCGRYVSYAHPDTPTFGLIAHQNSCEACHRMYPMPSWRWDSPDGRAYSYFRPSFPDQAFYDEFERDYKPDPVMGPSRHATLDGPNSG